MADQTLLDSLLTDDIERSPSKSSRTASRDSPHPQSQSAPPDGYLTDYQYSQIFPSDDQHDASSNTLPPVTAPLSLGLAKPLETEPFDKRLAPILKSPELAAPPPILHQLRPPKIFADPPSTPSGPAKRFHSKTSTPRGKLADVNSPRTPQPRSYERDRPLSAPSKFTARLLSASPNTKSPQVPKTPWAKQAYAPCMSCTKAGHALCKRRAELGIANVLSGKYVSDGSDEIHQVLSSDGTLRCRTDDVEDTTFGRCALMHLHLLRSHEIRDQDRRPLLFPDLPSCAESPPYRMLTGPKFFTGRFFNADHTCQKAECVLICFPKMHRGSVRLQLKVFNNHTGAVSSNADKDDFKVFDCMKVHFLSYVLWLFGMHKCSHTAMNKWPAVKGTCEYSRERSGNFKNDEFLCINPFHYLSEKEEPEATVEARVAFELTQCLKALPALPGERHTATGTSLCFCQP